MTGSSSKTHSAEIAHAPSAQLPHAPSVQLPHAPSVQWELLVKTAGEPSLAMQAQPAAWWRAQAERFMTNWMATGLPTTRLEDWKYTSLVSLHAKARRVDLSPVEVKAPGGVRVLRLSQAMLDATVSEVEREKIRTTLECDGNVFFENMAKSLVADPFVVFVPAKFKSDVPIEIHWRALPEGQWAFGVGAVLVGESADISIVERYGTGADAQTSSMSVHLDPYACVSHLRIQSGENRSEASSVASGVVLSSLRTRVEKGGKYEVAQVSFGSKLSREDMTVELCEEEAEAVTDGVFIGRSNQLLDHHTNLVHRVGSTTSRQIYKGILSDESRGVFNGRIAIEKNASGSNSSQMNKNLLLSKKVELDTKPQLEIDNDDVKAAHGAAIGRLDADHIFYLRSRGIPQSQAVEILARGFAGEAVQRLSSDLLRSIGNEEIERGLRGLSWEAL